MAKEKGEWTSRVLAEVKGEGSVIWRAEISTAPDGKEFAGVRKYVQKADGSVTPTASGISFLYDGGSLPENIDLVCGLFDKLRGGKIKVKPTKPAKPTAKAKPKVNGCVLVKDELYLAAARKEGAKTKVRKTDDQDQAKRFANHAEAAKYAKKFNLSTAWITEDL